MSNTYILKYTLEELNETETSIESILEDVLSTVDNVNILFEYSPEQIRLLHKKYGDSAFLDPKTKKYPIVDMKGNKNQQLLYAAYIDLKRKSGITGTNDLAQKAKDMLDENMFKVNIDDKQTIIPLLEYLELII